MRRTILSVEVRHPQDLVLTRQRARQIAALLAFDHQDQARLATAVSEIVRNAFQYAGGGVVDFAIEENGAAAFLIQVRDRGPGFNDVQAVMDGQATTANKGIGIVGVRRLMDRFQISSRNGLGTTVEFGKALPKRAGSLRDWARIGEELARRAPQDAFDELREQNRELLSTLDELRQRQTELAAAHEELRQREAALSQLNQELEDTNRGVVALYAELEDKAEFLGRTSEMKSRFLSNMSHEFRTPLNSITGLARLLLDRIDGELTAEQEKQVTLIRSAATSLTELVNDLLDLAKVEAGKVTVRPTGFEIASLFGGLRGMLRPLLGANSSVELIFDEASDLPMLQTDESKVSQIMRNFISNALKFTDKGEVRVSATKGPEDTVILSVADTGIGIASEDQALIFEEFAQIEGPHQKRAKGTGLGLPLVKKLAGLLGGRIAVKSKLGAGSTFSAIIPRQYHGPVEVAFTPEVAHQVDPGRLPVLVVEDNRETLFIYEKYLRGTAFQVIPAQNLAAARRALASLRPVAIVLDVLLDHENGWDLLVELKETEATRDIPVLVVTLVENEHKARSLGAEAYCAKPMERVWLLDKLNQLAPPRFDNVLLIDDDEASRYLLRGWLAGTGANVTEASNGADGLRFAHAEPPDLVFLDLELPDQSGVQVLGALRSTPATHHVAVIINTSKVLNDDERQGLFEAGATAVLSKAMLAAEGGRDVLRESLRKARSDQSVRQH